jgi:hypothetical protein
LLIYYLLVSGYYHAGSIDFGHISCNLKNIFGEIIEINMRIPYIYIYISLVFFFKNAFGVAPSCANGLNSGDEQQQGRISALSKLHNTPGMQKFDMSALNLKNSETSSSMASTNVAISITLSDFNNFTAVGKTWLDFIEKDESFTMNIGSANTSTPQTWSLPSNFLTYFEGAGRSDFVDISEVPLSLQIAGANKVMRSYYYDENDRPMDVYDHYDFAVDGVYHIGSSYDLEAGDDDAFDEDNYEVTDVPFDIGDNFNSISEETDHVTDLKTEKNVSTVTVNGFGSITTPTGTHECLRIISTVETYSRPNESSGYSLLSTENYISFLSKNGELFKAKVSATSGTVTLSKLQYRTVVSTELLSENNDVKLNNDSKGVTINIDNDTAHPSAILDIKNDSLGILIPRIAQINRPYAPATGLLVYQVDNIPGFYYFDGTVWQRLGTSSGPSAITKDNSARVSSTENLNLGGRSTLSKGFSLVKFSHPIENFEKIQLNIQLEEDCNGVFISRKTKDGFEVRELQKGKSNASFSWKIINE